MSCTTLHINQDIENLEKLARLFKELKQLSEKDIELNEQRAPQGDRDPIQEQYDTILFSADLRDAIKGIYLMAEAFIDLRKVTNESVGKVKDADLDYDCLTHQFC